MYLGSAHLDSIDVDPLLSDALEELDRMAAIHRFLVTRSHNELYNRYDSLLAEHGSNGSYDGGDAASATEQEFGFDPWAVERFAGSMTLVRGVALVEIVLARLAAACWSRPDLMVFPLGKVWTRDWAALFYKTCLVEPFDIDGNGFGALQRLRDVITHGYGTPVVEATQSELARDLHTAVDSSPLTAEEAALGYDEPASFFGETATYTPSSGLSDLLSFRVPPVDPTPLATYRALQVFKRHLTDAALAVQTGLSTPEDTNFVKKVTKFWSHPNRVGRVPEQ